VVHILERNVVTIIKTVEAMAADSEMIAKVWVRCNNRIWAKDLTTVRVRTTRTPPLGGKKRMRWS